MKHWNFKTVFKPGMYCIIFSLLFEAFLFDYMHKKRKILQCYFLILKIKDNTGFKNFGDFIRTIFIKPASVHKNSRTKHQKSCDNKQKRKNAY